MTNMATHYKYPSPGGHEIYNFGKPFLCFHYFMSDPCHSVDKKRRNIAF